jgi:hypothetical protein
MKGHVRREQEEDDLVIDDRQVHGVGDDDADVVVVDFPESPGGGRPASPPSTSCGVRRPGRP